MNVVRQLNRLQEVDLELESDERTLSQIVRQIGESEAITRARAELASMRQQLEELKRQQHAKEWEIEDLTNKIAPAEEKLYSGRITNPKELANLQHEVEAFKVQRSQIENKALEIMEQVEQVEASIATANSELGKLEAEWQDQQRQLSRDMEQVKATLADLRHKQQLLSAGIEPQTVELYHQLRKQKGTGVARVEQGVCSGCRISLSTAKLQQVRSGSLVQCSNCGRIMYLA